MSTPPSPQPPSIMPLPPAEFARWYGAWQPLQPAELPDFMAGFDRPWWVIGGWALEAFTGVHREHEDTDISILAADAQAFRAFLGQEWTTWTADEGWLRPFDDRFGDPRPHSGIWVRRAADQPWVLDVPLTPDTNGLWTNKSVATHTAPVADVTWVGDDGLRYLNPELVLARKAAQVRPKDVTDAHVALPLLSQAQRERLSAAIAPVWPDHPWHRW